MEAASTFLGIGYASRMETNSYNARILRSKNAGGKLISGASGSNGPSLTTFKSSLQVGNQFGYYSANY